LHISQPTISRDIYYIYHQKKTWQRKYANELLLEVQNTLYGLSEIIKKLWIIVDDPKAEQKEKMKSISIIIQCYNRRLDLLNFEPQVNDLKEYIDTIKREAKDIDRREKTLEDYLKKQKLTQQEIDSATDPNAVF
jgi:uncharacterized UPF0160 family protein